MVAPKVGFRCEGGPWRATREAGDSSMIGIAAMTMAYVLSQFFRSFMAVLTPALMADLGATRAELSAASGWWFASFALMQFVVGLSLDRFGPRGTVTLISGIGCGLGCLVFAGASAPWMIALAMALIGAGCAPVLMSAMFIFARSYPPARLAVLVSTVIGIGSIGNVAGTAPLAAAAELWGWRQVLFVIGIVSIVTALAVLALVRNPPRVVAPAQGGGLIGYLHVLGLRRLWTIIPLIGLNYAPMIGILGLWTGPYLSEVYGADTLAIGRVTFFMALSVVAGSFAYGPLDTIFGTRKWVAVVGNSGSVLVLAGLALFPALGVVAVTVALCLVGLFGSSYALLMAHGRAFVPAHLTGRGITLLNFFSIGSVGVMQMLSGWVVDAFTEAARPEAAYVALFGFYSATVAVGVAIYLFSRDAPPERDVIRPAGASTQ